MAKLCGFISAHIEQPSIAARLHEMAVAMQHDSATSIEFLFDRGGLAILGAAPTESPTLGWTQERHHALALAGYVDNALSSCADLPLPNPVMLSDPTLAVLQTALAAQATTLLPRLNGVFALASYDATTETLRLANDRYGFAPLYYYHDERGLWFASEVKALLRVLGPQEPDWEAYADFFYVGHMLGQKTLFKRISAFDSGQLITYQNGHLRIDKYYDFARTPVMDAADVSVDRLGELFVQAVQRQLQPEKRNTILLSGGFDSRLILGALHQLGVEPRVLSLEHAGEHGGADGKFAVATARSLGLACELRPTRPNFYASKDCLDAFYILDGMIPSWELFISQVYAELDGGLGVIWDGMALDVVLGGSQQIAAESQQNMPEFLDKRPRRRPLLKQIFTSEVFQMLDRSFMARVRHELAKVPPSDNQYLYFLLQNRTRRRITPNSYQLFASKVEPRTPGADKDLLDYILAIPPSLRLQHKIYIDLLREKFPVLIQTPVISGGKLVYFNKSDTSIKNVVTKRLRAIVKRNFRKINLKGRLRAVAHRSLTAGEQELANVIIPVLEQKHFDRPFYNAEMLRQRFAQYRAGDGRHHDLFSVVFYIELWHLLFIDQDSSPLFNEVNSLFTILQPAEFKIHDEQRS